MVSPVGLLPFGSGVPNRNTPNPANVVSEADFSPVKGTQVVPEEDFNSSPSVSQQARGALGTGADMMLGWPGAIAQTVTEGVTDLTGVGYSLLHPEEGLTSKDILSAGSEAGRRMQDSPVFNALRGAGSRRFGDFENPLSRVFGGVGSSISEAGNLAEKHGVPQEAVEQLSDNVMAFFPEYISKGAAGYRAVRGVANKVLMARVDKSGLKPESADPKQNQAFQDFVKKASSEPLTPEEVKTAEKEMDRHKEAEEIAADLERRQASRAQVLKEIKKNPLVKDKLMERAADRDAKAKWDEQALEKLEEQKRATLIWDAVTANKDEASVREGKMTPGQAAFRAKQRAAKLQGLMQELNARKPSEQPPNRGTLLTERPKSLPDLMKGLQTAVPDSPKKGALLSSVQSKVVAAAALAGIPVAAWMAQNPDEVRKLLQDPGGDGAVAAAVMFPTLRTEMGSAKLGSRILESLPQDRVEIKRETIQNQLKRTDIPKAERDVIQGLVSSMGDKIPAKDLMQQFKLATQQFELSPVDTHLYADHGLSRITSDPDVWDDREARSTVWQLPDSWNIPAAGHFEDLGPNQYGHTRSFKEGGVWNVVELQSDLLQHQSVLTAEKRSEIEKGLKAWENALLKVRKKLNEFPTDWDKDERSRQSYLDVNNNVELSKRMVGELKAALAGGAVDQLSPVAKQWPRRLIQEELARAGREGLPMVRFADADTVAKVEGWPFASHDRKYTRDVELIKANIKYLEEHPEIPAARNLENYKEQLKRVEAGKPGKVGYGSRQGIYDRYAGEITRYLKSLGAKHITDSEGHGWYELPSRPGVPARMSGAADPRTLAVVALGAGAATLAAWLSDRDKLEAAIAAGAVGAAAGLLLTNAKHLSNNWKDTLGLAATTAGVSYGLSRLDKDHPAEGALLGMLWGASRLLPPAAVPKVGNLTIDELANLNLGALQAVARKAANIRDGIKASIPDPVRRAEVSKLIESGNHSTLTPEEKQVADAWKTVTDDYAKILTSEGLLHDFIDNYVPHIVEKVPTATVGGLQALLDSLLGPQGGSSPRAGFLKARKYATFNDLQNALQQHSGLQIKTMDISEIAHSYITSVERVLANKRFVDNFKLESKGNPAMIQRADKAPPEYIHLAIPQLRGKLIQIHPNKTVAQPDLVVHPDLAPSLSFLLEPYRPGALMNLATAVSMASKRLNVAGSFFHAENIGTAYLAAGGATDLIFRKGQAISAALQAYRSGGAGDTIDYGLRNGLMVEAGRPEETGIGSAQRLGAMIDKGLASAGIKTSITEGALGRIDRFQRNTFDKVTWDYAHTGAKLATFSLEFEKAVRQAEKKSGQPSTHEQKNEIARQVAAYVNDTFGGQDWYRLATDDKSKIGRALALSMLSPKGRAAMQIAVFAPDWTYSTFRSIYKALPYSGSRPLTRSLHQQYALRSAVMVGVISNTLNYLNTGHFMWDNDEQNKFRIQTRSGLSYQPFRHSTEFYEFLKDPVKILTGKLGYIPKEALSQLWHREYLGGDPRKQPEMQGSRILHVAKDLAPMSVQGLAGRPERDLGDKILYGLAGTAGIPVYGETKAEKSKRAEIHRREKLAR